MFVAKSIAADHKDLIHDVSYDFHGRRMATCSSDQSVKVWDKGDDGEWRCTASWKTHSGSVWRVTWAHPEFGQVLASCSFDRTAAVWEEIVGESNDKQRGQSHWFVLPFSSRAHPPMIAVGSDDSNVTYSGKVQIYEYNENTRKYAKAETLMTVTDPVHDITFAPNLGRSFHVLAIATKDVRIFKLVPLRRESANSSGPTKFEVQVMAQFDSHNSQVWRVSWNITSTLLASSGDDGCVRLWKANYMDNWKCTGILRGDGSPVNGSGHAAALSAVGVPGAAQMLVGATSAGRKKAQLMPG
ncbi:nucleoporin seh1-like [Sinocyclocheilus grahami]|uniref:nucleoporin seh1-like n=1 Tax=Sinocyclocheilus grahami TaxID=75366 RepID=UPI0007AC9963|nr:PREDICTED: nucleoporin seh1-like [Sinocyclocheilus grahami]